MAHLNPVPLADVKDDDIRERFEHYRRTRGFTPNSIMTMVRRPDIVRAFMALNQAVLYEGTVPVETKMLVSLACSYAAGCRYCQSHMTNLASLYQASDAKIAALWKFEDSELFNDAERAAIRLALKAGAQPAPSTSSTPASARSGRVPGMPCRVVIVVSLLIVTPGPARPPGSAPRRGEPAACRRSAPPRWTPQRPRPAPSRSLRPAALSARC